MRKIYKSLAYLSIVCFAFSINAQSQEPTKKTKKNFIWQQNGSNNSKFDFTSVNNKAAAVDIIEYESFAAFPTGWSTVENVGNGALAWVHTTTGGAWGGQLASSSAADGYMMFDSDGYGGVGGEDVDLISKSYDLSAITDPNVKLNLYFEHYARTYGAAEIFVYVSTDDFATETLLYDWGSTAAVNEANGNNPVISMLDITNEALGEGNVKFKFKWTGDYDYWWLIDDVAIIQETPKDNDLDLSNLYFGNYSGIPVHQSNVTDVSADITNIGVFAQTNVRLNVTAGSFDNSSAASSLAADATANFLVPNFSLNTVGNYTLKMEALQNQIEDDPSDNADSIAFSISDDIFARDRAIAGDYGGGSVGAGADNNYTIVNEFEVTKEAVASSVQFAVAGSVGANVDVVLYANDTTTVLAESTGGYTIVGGDVSAADNLVILEMVFDFPATLQAGDTVYAGIRSNTLPVGEAFQVATTQPLPNSASSLISFGTNFNLASDVGANVTGVLRLKLEDICDYTTIVANEVITDASCNSLVDGSIQLNPTGGSVATDYQYDWTHDGGLNSNLAADLGAGVYPVTVTDDNGCEGVFSTLTVNEPVALDMTSTPTDASGCGVADGSILVDYSNAPAETDYTVDWAGPTTGTSATTDPAYDFNITGLQAGLYYVTTSSVTECSQDTVQVNETGAATILKDVITDESCLDAADGSVSITSDQTGYTFEYRDQMGGLVASGVDQLSATGLPAGTYSVTGNDGTCTSNTLLLKVGKGVMLDLDLAVTSAISCVGQNDAALTVTFANLTEDITTYNFTWNDGTTDLAETSDQITGLAPGTYNVVANGLCTSNNPSITVDPASGLLELNLNIDNPIECNGGDGTITVTSPSDLTGYTFDWDFDGVAMGETGASVTGTSGSYDVVGNGTCATETASITLTEPDAITVTGDVVESETEATITTTAIGGTGAYDVAWTGPNGYTSTGAEAVVTENGTYTATYTDANGCTGSTDFVASTISVETFAKNNVKVYPNPAKTNINFDVKDAGATNIYVYDVTGKSVASIDATNNSLVKLNVENLENGMYLYHITKQDGTMIVSSKFTVVK